MGRELETFYSVPSAEVTWDKVKKRQRQVQNVTAVASDKKDILTKFDGDKLYTKVFVAPTSKKASSKGLVAASTNAGEDPNNTLLADGSWGFYDTGQTVWIAIPDLNSVSNIDTAAGGKYAYAPYVIKNTEHATAIAQTLANDLQITFAGYDNDKIFDAAHAPYDFLKILKTKNVSDDFFRNSTGDIDVDYTSSISEGEYFRLLVGLSENGHAAYFINVNFWYAGISDFSQAGPFTTGIAMTNGAGNSAPTVNTQGRVSSGDIYTVSSWMDIGSNSNYPVLSKVFVRPKLNI